MNVRIEREYVVLEGLCIPEPENILQEHCLNAQEARSLASRLKAAARKAEKLRPDPAQTTWPWGGPCVVDDPTVSE